MLVNAPTIVSGLFQDLLPSDFCILNHEIANLSICRDHRITLHNCLHT